MEHGITNPDTSCVCPACRCTFEPEAMGETQFWLCAGCEALNAADAAAELAEERDALQFHVNDPRDGGAA